MLTRLRALLALLICAALFAPDAARASALSSPITAISAAGSASIGAVAANRRRQLIPYNTLFGVTDPVTGWIDFPLHSGNRRVWLNGRDGSDSNSCLSAAAACATFDHTFAVFTAGTSGDQLMMAGRS